MTTFLHHVFISKSFYAFYFRERKVQVRVRRNRDREDLRKLVLKKSLTPENYQRFLRAQQHELNRVPSRIPEDSPVDNVPMGRLVDF